MNLTGKILTFFITVSSLIFMGLAVAVFVTHQNWYLAVNRTQEETQGGRLPLGYKYQLQNERTKYADLKGAVRQIARRKRRRRKGAPANRRCACHGLVGKAEGRANQQGRIRQA